MTIKPAPISPQALWLVCAIYEKWPCVGTWVEAWTREEAGAAAGLRPEEVRAVYSEHEVSEGKWREPNEKHREPEQASLGFEE